MSGAPVITIFVRHAASCKYIGDEFCKRCNCRKHFRWSQNGTQYRRKAGTRSWAEAEEIKRRLEDQLAGRVTPSTEAQAVTLQEAIALFDSSKRAQGIVEAVRKQYALDLRRLQQFSEARNLFTAAQALTLTNLLAWRGTWGVANPSTYSQSVIQRRVRHFLRFAYDAGWIEKLPHLSPIKITEPQTQPLTEAEYKKLLAHAKGKVRTLIQLMRWSGLAIRDASLLKREDLVHKGDSFKIMRERTKTGTPLFIPIPPDIGREVLTVANGNPMYVFWDRQTAESSEVHASDNWSKAVSRVFDDAGIVCDGHMVSHRLRDTFAVDLLQKGVPLEHVSKLLGHKSVTTTERHYARWVKGRQDLLERVVSATWKK
jgi:integrase/recombinase XerD